MIKLNKLLSAAALFACAGTAQAVIIDFVDLAENSLGESAWSKLIIPTTDFTLEITGENSNGSAFAYLDYGHAGLGVCGAVFNDGNGSPKVGLQHAGSRANVCNPGSDDNVTTGEILSFAFDADVIIEKIWFNNTHDADRTIDASDLVVIEGTPEQGPGNGYAPTSSQYNTFANYDSDVDNFLGQYFVNIFSTTPRTFSIGFNNQQFYVSGLQVALSPFAVGSSVETVPVSGVLSLLGLGLFALGFSRRAIKPKTTGSVEVVA